MRNLIFLSTIILFLFTTTPVKSKTIIIDTLSTILESKLSKEEKQEKIIRLSYARFLYSSGDTSLVNAMADSLIKYKLPGEQEFSHFAKVLILRHNFELDKAEKLLNQSIEIALQSSERVFLYQFYQNQAYVQTDLRNPINAIYNYRLARKIAEEIGKEEYFISTDVGISDIYTNIGLYDQALIYLSQAQEIFNRQKQLGRSTQYTIYLNKAEVYFKLGQADSLNKYIRLVKQYSDAGFDIKRNLIRLTYLSHLLNKKYKEAIPLIKKLLITGNQYYKGFDRWHLAECYYHVNEGDSAIAIASRLTQDTEVNSFLIKLDSYKLLAKIYGSRNQMQQANNFLALALKESENYTLRISKIGDIASELRLDHMAAGYQARQLIYQKERTILALVVVLAILALIIIIASYRNIRQKNRFQKLLHQARSKELAFINSHQVRKPLANILGICLLADHKDTKVEEIVKYIQLIKEEATQMDDKLTEVEKKLKTQV